MILRLANKLLLSLKHQSISWYFLDDETSLIESFQIRCDKGKNPINN